MHEFSLITLSTLLQSAIGLSVLLFIYRRALLVDAGSHTTTKTMFVIAAMASAGLLIGATHLGYPLNAINSVNNIQTSWLSREVLFATVFIASVGLLFLLGLVKKTFDARLLGVACLFGVLDIFALANIYQNSSIITWNESYTMALHMGGTILLGSLCTIAYMAVTRRLTGDIIRALLILIIAVIALRAVCLIELVSSLEAKVQEQGVMFPWNSIAAFRHFESLLITGWALGIASVAGMIFYLYKNKGAFNVKTRPLLFVIIAMVMLYEMLCRIHFYQFYI